VSRLLAYRVTATVFWMALTAYGVFRFHGWAMALVLVFMLAAVWQVLSWFWFDH
jgi:hypothetical protein